MIECKKIAKLHQIDVISLRKKNCSKNILIWNIGQADRTYCTNITSTGENFFSLVSNNKRELTNKFYIEILVKSYPIRISYMMKK